MFTCENCEYCCKFVLLVADGKVRAECSDCLAVYEITGSLPVRVA